MELIHVTLARVVKLVNTHASEACGSNPLEVQVLSRAPRLDGIN